MKYFIDFGKRGKAWAASNELDAATMALFDEYERLKDQEIDENLHNHILTDNIINMDYLFVEVRPITDKGWDDSPITKIPLENVFFELQNIKMRNDNENNTY